MLHCITIDRRAKIGLGGLLCLSCIAFVASIVKLVEVHALSDANNYTCTSDSEINSWPLKKITNLWYSMLDSKLTCVTQMPCVCSS